MPPIKTVEQKSDAANVTVITKNILTITFNKPMTSGEIQKYLADDWDGDEVADILDEELVGVISILKVELMDPST